MSELPPPPSGPPFFRPLTLLAGFMLGLVFFAWLGRHLTRQDWHKDFVRFHPMIAPDSLYQPTVGEMSAIVRARCRPDQVLVIVGGNSILLGVGQPADQVWTRRLQELLGDHFAVVNLAFRGAGPTDGGAVVAEALRNEFPHQIYLANVTPIGAGSPVGIDTYRFALLDAYFKGLLLPWKPREDGLNKYFSAAQNASQVTEIKWGSRLDAALHFQDFWNWWSYTQFFTFPTPLMPKWPESYWARDRFTDNETVYDSTPFDQKFSPEIRSAEIRITRNYSALFYEKDASNHWTLKSKNRKSFTADMREAFPDPLKKRTLLIITRNSPFYTNQMEGEARDRDELSVRESIQLWQSAGYSAADAGHDFLQEDFGDRTHLTTQGGLKLAANVAPAVSALADKLGYLKP